MLKIKKKINDKSVNCKFKLQQLKNKLGTGAASQVQEYVVETALEMHDPGVWTWGSNPSTA